MDERKGGDPISLSLIETWKNPFEVPSQNCPSCLVWHRSGLAWVALTQVGPRHSFGVFMSQTTIPKFPIFIVSIANNHCEPGHPFLKVKRA